LSWLESNVSSCFPNSTVFAQSCFPSFRSKQNSVRCLPSASLAQVRKTRPLETIGLLFPG